MPATTALQDTTKTTKANKSFMLLPPRRIVILTDLWASLKTARVMP